MRPICFFYFLIAILCLTCEQQQNTPSKNPSLSDTSKTESKPLFIDKDAGKTWNIFGLKIVGKIMSSETGGQYAVVMSTTPPAGGPPLHVHDHEDELFYVVKGRYEFQYGDEKVLAEKGALVHLPRKLPHTFRNIGDSAGVLLNTITPGGFEKFFEDIDQLPKEKPLDRKKVTEIAAKYGLKFIR